MAKSNVLFKIMLFLAIINSLCLVTYMNKIEEPAGYGVTQIPDSCTIFTAAIGDKAYFGNNEDYKLEGTYMWLIPSQERFTPSGFKQIHGAVYFGFDNNNYPEVDGYPQGGMNDQGLCCDGNGLPPTDINYHSGLLMPYAHPFYEILWECSTVNETIEWFATHYLGSYLNSQLHYADATGDAVVVSVAADGEFAYTHINESTFLVSTNFNLANPANGYYPCQRYETASSMLANITTEEELTVEACREVLDAVHSEGLYGTKYSNIFDLVNRDIYIYYNQNFDDVAKLNLDDELAKVQPGNNDVETYNGVYYKSIRIVDLEFNPASSTKSFPVYAIVLIASSAGIAIIGSTFLIIYFKKSRTK